MQKKTVSVSELVFAIKDNLESEFNSVTVEGEVSNLSGSAAGHYYFTLSDKSASLSCALFKMDALRNPAIRKIKDGQQIMISGPVGVYAKRGSFQVIVKRVSPVGAGDLSARFEASKKKLAAAGFFDLERKKEVPKLPRKIAIITALKGAALQDFLNIMKRRSEWYDICIVPATMQGDSCASSVIKALGAVKNLSDVDVVVIARGGGSMEDLWGFNDERLVKAVFDFNIPVISAIGHQVDYTLLDFTSDLRAETPSSAAELLTTEQFNLRQRLKRNGKILKHLMLQVRGEIERQLERTSPKNLFLLLNSQLEKARYKLDRFSPRNWYQSDIVLQLYQELDDKLEYMRSSFSLNLQEKCREIEGKHQILESLSPKKVLKRGYTILETEEGKLLTSQSDFDKIAEETSLQVNFYDGVGSVKKS